MVAEIEKFNCCKVYEKEKSEIEMNCRNDSPIKPSDSTKLQWAGALPLDSFLLLAAEFQHSVD